MSHHTSPSCPRCGYDLSGAIAAWPGDRCPLGGVCSECGAVFWWGDAVVPLGEAGADDDGPRERSRAGHVLEWVVWILVWKWLG